jgi:hypothetical protein
MSVEIRPEDADYSDHFLFLDAEDYREATRFLNEAKTRHAVAEESIPFEVGS